MHAGQWAGSRRSPSTNSVFQLRTPQSSQHTCKSRAGEHHGLLLDVDGGVWALGQGGNGQLGAGPGVTACDSPVQIIMPSSGGHGSGSSGGGDGQHPGSEDALVAGSPVVQVACGFLHSAAVTKAGQVLTWGWGGLGSLGTGNQDDAWSPTVVGALGGLVIRQVAAGGGHCLALSDSGDVYAWGWNDRGQLGQGHAQCCGTPQLIEDITSEIHQVSAGAHHSLFLTTEGGVLACGLNSWGQLGLGHQQDQHSPVEVTLPEQGRVTSVEAGWWHSLLLVQPG